MAWSAAWATILPCPSSICAPAKVLEQTLEAGYTCVRDAGGLDAGFKQAVENGSLSGAASGPFPWLSSPPPGAWPTRLRPSGQCFPHDDPMIPSGIADGDDPVRAKVRENVPRGRRRYQVRHHRRRQFPPRPTGRWTLSLAPSEVKTLVAEARNLGRRAMCHAVGGPGLRMCVEAGVHSVEHGCYLPKTPTC